MSDLANNYRAMQADPEFAKLPYSEQVQLRNSALQKVLPADNDFRLLPPDQQQELYKRMVYAPPALENPALKQAVTQISQIADAGGDTTPYSQLYGYLGASYGGGALSNTLGGASIRLSHATGQNDPTQALAADLIGSGDDGAKVWQYLNARHANGMSGLTDTDTTLKDIYGFVANMADFMPLGPISGAVGGLVTKIPVVAKGIESANAITKFVSKTVLPVFGESLVVGGPSGLVQGYVLSQMNNDPEINPFNSFEQAAANFGVGAATNFVVGSTVAPLLAHLFGGIKGTLGKGLTKEAFAPKTMTDEGVQSMMKASELGDAVPPEATIMQSPMQAAVLADARNAVRIAKLSPSEMTPADKLVFATKTMPLANDVIVSPHEDGSFTVTHWKNTVDAEGKNVIHAETAHASTVFDAYDHVADIVSDRLPLLENIGNEKLKARIEEFSPWVKTWKATEIAPAQAVESALNVSSPSRVGVGDRPWIGGNEFGGGKMVPVKFDMTPEQLGRLQKGSNPLLYTEIKPMKPGNSGTNAMVLTSNVKRMPIESFDPTGPNGLIQSRIDGYDTIALVDRSGAAQAYVPLSPKNVKFMVPEVELKTGQPKLSKTTPRVAKPGSEEKIAFAQAVNEKVPINNLSSNGRLLTQLGVRAMFGEIEPELVETFVKGLVSNKNIKVNISRGPEVKVVATKEGFDITVPPRTASATEAAKIMGDVTAKIDLLGREHMVGTGATKRVLNELRAMSSRSSDPFFKILDTTEGVDRLASQAWLANVLKNELGVDIVKTPKGYSAMVGGKAVEGSLSDIYQAAKPYLSDPISLRKALIDSGYTVTQHKSGEVTLKASNGLGQKFNSLSEAAQSAGIDQALLPPKYRPTFVEIDPSSNEVHIFTDRNAIQLDKQAAMDLLNSFANDQPEVRPLAIQSKSGVAMVYNKETSVEVVHGNSQSKMYFPDLPSAVKWATEELPQWSGLKDLALNRGLDIKYNKGMFEVRTGSGDGSVFRVKTRAEVEEVMASYPTKELDATEQMPGAAEDLDLFPPEILKQWKAMNQKFNPVPIDPFGELETWRIRKEPSAIDTARQAGANVLLTNEYAWGKAVKENRIPKMMDSAREHALAAHNSYYADVLHNAVTIDDILKVNKAGAWETGKGGKVLSESRLRVLTEYLDNDVSHWDNLRKTDPITPAEEQMLSRARQYLGEETPTGITGMGGRFGITVKNFRDNYVSHIRSELNDPQTLAHYKAAGTPSDFIDYLAAKNSNKFDKRWVGEAKLWFENSRKSDLTSMIFEDNLRTIMHQYVKAGLRKLHMNIPMQEYNAAYNAIEKNLDKPTKEMVMHTGNMIFGLEKPDAIATAIAAFGRGSSEAFGKILYGMSKVPGLKQVLGDPSRFINPKFALSGEKLLNNFFQIQNASLLGMKPMMAMRQTAQLYTTFAPVFGMDYLNDAVQWHLNVPANQIDGLARKLIQTNVLTARHYFTAETDASAGIQKFTNAWLKFFLNGDDYTRFLGYVAATRRFSDGVDRLGRGVWGDINSAEAKSAFMNFSRLKMFQESKPTLVDAIWSRVQSNASPMTSSRLKPDALFMGTPELSEAAHLYAKNGVDFTLFNYNSWNKPMLFSKSTIGRAVGQLGMFAPSYRSYMYTLYGNANKGNLSRLAFTASFMAINLAFFSAFKTMQVKTNDFIPFLPGIGGFGPTMETVMEIAGHSPQDVSKLAKDYSPFLIQKDPYAPKTGPAKDDIENYQLNLNYPHLSPGWAQINAISKAHQYAQDGDWYKALLSLTTAATEPESQDDLPIGVKPFQVVIPQANPPTVLANAARSLTERRQPRLPIVGQ